MNNHFKCSVSGIAAAALLATSLPMPVYANEVGAAALTDEEAGRLAAEMDVLPAGAGGEGAFKAVILVALMSIWLIAKAVEKVVDGIASSRSTSTRESSAAQAMRAGELHNR
jgi:hypothetical protein